ncbi:hypothetical protein SSP531S_54520 [Streptomyces spongiicola]|uniref:Uncharacterized protein n=1 Tax=Streptomyces spongiicola TaxID=1690221 RepID=A0A388T629_9ACTN|nr:DUF6274 family protein [Streptomyces spongiicola]GBQ03966.1 hypothetical protein SSP531S_54520 [Streptomyces spongiicola]
MAASTARHETGALLRAHLSAVSGYRHLTRQCPVCHRLLRLAMDPAEAVPEGPAAPSAASLGGRQTPFAAQALGSRENAAGAAERGAPGPGTTGLGATADADTAVDADTAAGAGSGTAIEAGRTEAGRTEAGRRAGSGGEASARP